MNQRSSDAKLCPYCAEEVKAAAIVCRFCNRPLPGHEEKIPQPIGKTLPIAIEYVKLKERQPSFELRPRSNKRSLIERLS